MSPIVTKTGLTRIAIFTAVALVIMIFLAPFTPSATQRRNMARAEAHCRLLRNLFTNNASYAHIQFSRLTDESILVHGMVSSSNTLNHLKSTIVESNPPRPVKYKVIVEPLLFE